jgi:glycosyltransferase involved in cell wall biosynthesis
MTPDVCIALPVKNGAAFLGQTLDSVLAQQGVDFEVRIRDNLSTDDSVAIAEEYAARDPRISVAVNDEDVLTYGSLNRILADTDAEWFVPFAADDLMAPDNVARKLEAVRAEDATFAHSSARIIDQDGNPIQIAPDHTNTPRVLDPPQFFRVIAPNNQVSGQSVLVRTEALRAIGGFDMRAYYCADWFTWMRLALRERTVTLPEPLISNRVHAAAGTAVLNAVGINGRDIPATLDAMFTDEAMPPEWLAMRDQMMAANLENVAHVLHSDGVRRVRQGWAGYMTLGRALARAPEDPRLRDKYLAYVGESGLYPPRLPYDAVAPAPDTEDDAAALRGLVDRLGPLLGALAIAVEPDGAERAMGLLEPFFGDTEEDVSIVPTETTKDLLLPGRLALARWESDFVAQAEDAGVPVQPYAMPDRFRQPAETARWEIFDAGRALRKR